jgi:hypothetical protein
MQLQWPMTHAAHDTARGILGLRCFPSSLFFLPLLIRSGIGGEGLSPLHALDDAGRLHTKCPHASGLTTCLSPMHAGLSEAYIAQIPCAGTMDHAHRGGWWHMQRGGAGPWR